MEFLRDSIRKDPARQDFLGIFAKFEMSLEEIRQNIEGINWIISKIPKAVEKQSDTDRLTIVIVKKMKEEYMTASLLMRKELGSHVE